MGEMFHMSQKSRQFQKALFNTDQISSQTDLSQKEKSIHKTPTHVKTPKVQVKSKYMMIHQ